MARNPIRIDDIDEYVADFDSPPLRERLVVNSVPKCGTHLIKNVVKMFVPADQQYGPSITHVNHVKPHEHVFTGEKKWMAWGHFAFTEYMASLLRGARHVILVRDPYDYVLAYTRFLYAEQLHHTMHLVKEGKVAPEATMNLIVLGSAAGLTPLISQYDYHALGWLGTGAKFFKYEDLVASVRDLDSPEAEAFFRRLLDACGIDMPADWKERVRLGADPRFSMTARQNLTVAGGVIPETLSEEQRLLVDHAAPGLRKILGYA